MNQMHFLFGSSKSLDWSGYHRMNQMNHIDITAYIFLYSVWLYRAKKTFSFFNRKNPVHPVHSVISSKFNSLA